MTEATPRMPSAAPPSHWQRADSGLALALMAAVLLTYSGVLSHQFVAWDDDSYISKNIRMLQGLSWDNLRWALTATAVSNWHPLTWWSYFFDTALWGNWAGGFALTSVVLHGLNSVLLFAFLRAATGERWRPVLVAALFALHPLHVESVAWVSERKDVLCGLFWLLTMAAYLRYARRGGVAAYLLVTLALALAMMAKPMAIMLPVALLCLDVWPLGRIRPGGFFAMLRALLRLLPEKLPWLAMSVALVAVTVASQFTAVLSEYPLSLRVMTVVNGYRTYLAKTIWPADLHFYYLTENVLSPGAALISALVLLAVSWLAWRVRFSRPVVLAGWLWFVLTLLPVIGIVKAGAQAYADRYHYLPSIGLSCMLLWGVPWDKAADLMRNGKRVLVAAALVLLAGLGFLSLRQSDTWRDSETLFSHAIKIEPNHYVALIGLAKLRKEQGRAGEAEALAAKAESLSLSPAVRGAASRIFAGNAAAQGNQQLAAQFYATALAVEPANAENHFSFGTTQFLLGDLFAAEASLRQAVVLHPEYGDAWLNLGAVFSRQGRFADALAAHRRAMSALPRDHRLRLIYAQRLIDAGQTGDAGRQLSALAAEVPAASSDGRWLARLQSALTSAGGNGGGER